MLVVGTIVKIKSLDWYKSFGTDKVSLRNNIFVSEMSMYCGVITTISKICDNDNYKVDIDGGRWNWTSEMFDPIDLTDYHKVGDTVVIKGPSWYISNERNGEIICGEIAFVNTMKKYLGKTAKIVSSNIGSFIDYDDKICSYMYYYLDIDNQYWKWTEQMFSRENDGFDSFTLIPFGEVYIAVDKLNNISIPEFFNNQEDFENYVKKHR